MISRLFRALFLGLVWFYQRFISPLTPRQLPLRAHLLGLCGAGHQQIRAVAGRAPGAAAHCQLPPLGRPRLRPRTLSGRLAYRQAHFHALSLMRFTSPLPAALAMLLTAPAPRLSPIKSPTPPLTRKGRHAQGRRPPQGQKRGRRNCPACAKWAPSRGWYPKARAWPRPPTARTTTASATTATRPRLTKSTAPASWCAPLTCRPTTTTGKA